MDAFGNAAIKANGPVRAYGRVLGLKEGQLMMHFNGGPYLVSEVAKQMGVCAETVRRAIRSGDLKAQPKRGTTKPMYVKAEDIERWKESMFA